MSRVTKQRWQDVAVYMLENDRFAVSVCPELGSNVMGIRDRVYNREMLRRPETKDQLIDKPVHYGTPILLPPNRIRKGTFTYDGRTYQFDINVPNGNHIHGLHKVQPWKVSSIDENDDEASITTTLRTEDFPDWMRQYPHEMTIEMTVSLKQSTITQTFEFTNRSRETAPFGFGLHTWFRIDGEPEQWTLRLPASGIWELDEELIPTGQIHPLGDYGDLLTGMNLQGANLDTVFQIGDRERTATLAKNGYELRYSVSPEFKHWVIYTMGEANEYICLEPYTWVTNAPNLNLPAEVTGMRGIAPNETLRLAVRLEIVHP